MLLKDFAGTTAGIIRATNPNITASIQPDWASIIRQAGQDYQTGKQLRADDTLTEQLIAQNPEKEAEIRQMGGRAYADMLKAEEQRAQERQWKLDDLATAQDFQRELSQLKFAQDMKLEGVKNANAWGLKRWDLENTLAQKEMERQQALEDAATQREFQKELAELKFKQDSDLEGIKSENARGLALFKAQNGIGTSGLVNINMNPLDKKRIETIGKKMDENISASQARLDDYNRMEQLLNSPNVTTGGLRGLAQDSLPDALLNPETVELRSIIKKIVPQMRPSGSGTTSDRDMKIFEQATVGLGKSKDANLNIVRGRKLVDENNIAKEELRYQWLSEGGNLGDFDKKWRDYLNANPIFANDSAKLNQSRKDPYEWFYNPQGNQTNTTATEDPLGLR